MLKYFHSWPNIFPKIYLMSLQNTFGYNTLIKFKVYHRRLSQQKNNEIAACIIGSKTAHEVMAGMPRDEVV